MGNNKNVFASRSNDDTLSADIRWPLPRDDKAIFFGLAVTSTL